MDFFIKLMALQPRRIMTIPFRAFAFLLLMVTCQATPKSCSFTYKTLLLCYPLTVGEAVKQYKLSYKPPGFYYRDLSDSTQFVLDYAYSSGDFDNEYQPENTLYERVVNTYEFSFPDSTGRFDSKRLEIESLIGSKMEVSEQQIGVAKILPASSIDRYPDKGFFKLAEGQTKDNIRVFLREIPRAANRQKKMLQLFFFKNKDSVGVYNRVRAFS